jgi:hypothetical protein
MKNKTKENNKQKDEYGDLSNQNWNHHLGRWYLRYPFTIDNGSNERSSSDIFISIDQFRIIPFTCLVKWAALHWSCLSILYWCGFHTQIQILLQERRGPFLALSIPVIMIITNLPFHHLVPPRGYLSLRWWNLTHQCTIKRVNLLSISMLNFRWN